MPLAIFSALRLALDIHGLLLFPYNFQDSFPNSMKNVFGIMMGVALDLQIIPSNISIFNINSSVRNVGDFNFLMLIGFFLQCLKVFFIDVFHLIGCLFLRYFICLFLVYYEQDIFPIFSQQFYYLYMQNLLNFIENFNHI